MIRIDIPGDLPPGTYPAEIQVTKDGHLTVVQLPEQIYEIPNSCDAIHWRGQIYHLRNIVDMDKRAQASILKDAIHTKEREEKMRAYERACREQAIDAMNKHDQQISPRRP